MLIAQQSPDFPVATTEFELLLLAHSLRNHVFALLATFSRYFASLLQKGNRLMDNPSSYEHCLVLESTSSANCNSVTASSSQIPAGKSHGKLRWFVVVLMMLFLIGIGWGAVTAFKYTRANLGNWRQHLQARTGTNPLAGDLTPVKKD